MSGRAMVRILGTIQGAHKKSRLVGGHYLPLALRRFIEIVKVMVKDMVPPH
jgi:hypothetical protein